MSLRYSVTLWFCIFTNFHLIRKLFWYKEEWNSTHQAQNKWNSIIFFQAQNYVIRSSFPAPTAPFSSPETASSAAYGATAAYPTLEQTSGGASTLGSTSGAPALGVYPGLADYMGLELTEDVIRENMPEYLLPAVRQPVSLNCCYHQVEQFRVVQQIKLTVANDRLQI